MNTIKFLIVVSITLLVFDLSYHQIVNGYVDGNNNGIDDRLDQYGVLCGFTEGFCGTQQQLINNTVSNKNETDNRICTLSHGDLYRWNGYSCELDEKKYDELLKSWNVTEGTEIK